MTSWQFWSVVVQGLTTSIATSTVLGAWVQIVTRYRHAERMRQADRHQSELLAAMKPVVRIDSKTFMDAVLASDTASRRK